MSTRLLANFLCVVVFSFSGILRANGYSVAPLKDGGGSQFDGVAAISGQFVGGYSVFIDSTTGLGNAQPSMLNVSNGFSLPMPITYTSGAVCGINTAGEAVGEVVNAANGPQPISWIAGQPQLLTTGAMSNGLANSINNSGLIVGQISSASGSSQAAYWNGQTLTVLPGFTSASAVNDNGDIVVSGNYGGHTGDFVWSNNSITAISSAAGDFSARSINNNGDVAGVITVSGGVSIASIWKNGVSSLLLSNESISLDINDSDQIVGNAVNSDGSAYAFTYKDGSAFNLNDLIPSNSGWVLTEAVSINDDGVIVGNGLLNGHPQAYVLMPDGASGFSLGQTPEPGTVGMLAVAGVMLVRRRRR